MEAVSEAIARVRPIWSQASRPQEAAVSLLISYVLGIMVMVTGELSPNVASSDVY
jgi:hypothetical protein